MIDLDSVKDFIRTANINDIRELSRLNDLAWTATMNYGANSQIESQDNLMDHVVKMVEKTNKEYKKMEAYL